MAPVVDGMLPGTDAVETPISSEVRAPD